MPQSQIMASSKNPITDFFGSVVSTAEQALSRVGSEILPNWVGSQLGLQSTDQLESSTFNTETAPSRVESITQSSTGIPSTEKVLFDIGNIHVTTSTLLIVGSIFAGAILLFKKVL